MLIHDAFNPWTTPRIDNTVSCAQSRSREAYSRWGRYIRCVNMNSNINVNQSRHRLRCQYLTPRQLLPIIEDLQTAWVYYAFHCNRHPTEVSSHAFLQGLM